MVLSAQEQEIRCPLGSLMFSRPIGCHNIRYMKVPVFLSLGHYFSKQHVQCSMKPLNHSVSRRSIWSCAYLVNLHELTELFKQVRLKTWALICQYLTWHAKSGKHVYHQGLSYRYSLLISNRQSFRPSRKIVYRCQYIFVPFTGYRMRPGNVDSKSLHWFTNCWVLQFALPWWFFSSIPRTTIATLTKPANIFLPSNILSVVTEQCFSEYQSVLRRNWRASTRTSPFVRRMAQLADIVQLLQYCFGSNPCAVHPDESLTGSNCSPTLSLLH